MYQKRISAYVTMCMNGENTLLRLYVSVLGWSTSMDGKCHCNTLESSKNISIQDVTLVCSMCHIWAVSKSIVQGLLQELVTNDLSKISNGQSLYPPISCENGGTVVMSV